MTKLHKGARGPNLTMKDLLREGRELSVPR